MICLSAQLKDNFKVENFKYDIQKDNNGIKILQISILPKTLHCHETIPKKVTAFKIHIYK